MKRRTLLTAALAGAMVTPALGATTARAADPGPSVTQTGNTLLDSQAIYFVSYDGLVNNNSFQKNALLTYKGYQYAVWYTADRNAVVGRRVLGSGTWSTVKVGHTLRYNDSHNVISMGVSKVDGRLHLNMDSHSDGFTYVKSVAGLMDNPAKPELDHEPLRLPAVHPRRTGAHLAVHLSAVRLDARRQAPAELPRRHLRQRPQRPRRVRRHLLDQPRRVDQLHRHVHQRARLLHGPQHVPARHRLRPQRAPARPVHLARAERRRDVQQRRHHQPRHRLRLLRRPRPHLAQQRGHRCRHHRRRRQGLRHRQRPRRGPAEPGPLPDEPGEPVDRLGQAARTPSSATSPAASASARRTTSPTARPTDAPSSSARAPPAPGRRPRYRCR